MDMLAIFMFDPMYFIYVGPAILLALYAQMRVSAAFKRGSAIRPRSGMSGAETAQAILEQYGIHDVGIEPVQSFLGDHYDPAKKMLRLSPDVYHGRSLAAMGIAAHEVGHALQHAHRYGPLVVRGAIVPLASVGSNLSFLLILAGLFIAALKPLAIVGLILFGVVVVFQIVNLPVEFNASRRARAVLIDGGLITPEEDRVVADVLNAAALTYVAATITAALQLLYFASLVLGRRN